MLEDIKKSFTSAFDKRARSPLYGTLILSWCLWNWKAIYYVIVVPYSVEYDDRIYELTHNLSNWLTLWAGPILSTVFILGFVELLSNQVYRLSMYYRKQRIEIKQKYEGMELLDIEQSYQLKEENKKAKESLAKVTNDKDKIITELNSKIVESKHLLEQTINASTDKYNTDLAVHKDYAALAYTDNIMTFQTIAVDINTFGAGRAAPSDIEKFVKMGLIKQVESRAVGLYDLTGRGRNLTNYITHLNENYDTLLNE